MKSAIQVETGPVVAEQAVPSGPKADAGGCSLFCYSPRALASPSLTWAATPLRDRLRILRAARHRMAAQTEAFAAAISPRLARSQADTLVAELLPLLDACCFLERNAARILAPRKLGRGGRPLWLTGVHAEVHREPFGHVLVIGPANFPLFVPGTQVLQALAAGNTVTWKPGIGGAGVAQLVASALEVAGLPAGTLTVTDESVDAAQAALAAKPDKVIFTGSESAGRAVLSELAPTATPAVVELSGADAMLIMPSADLAQVAKAVAFGLRLNGASVCISPRRLFASSATIAALLPMLQAELAEVPAVALEDRTAATLQHLLFDAMSAGATVHGEFAPAAQRPLLVAGVTPQTAIARTDIFAPVLSLLPAQSMLHALEQYAQCPYALAASIFCGPRDEAKARSMAALLKAGTVLINDVIAPTADPRVPFGGRGISGYGVTRGEEGLLEMTAVKTLLVRKVGFGRGGLSTLHMRPLRTADTAIFSGLIGILHGKGLAQRRAALKILIAAVRR
jgi:acyl-CoA reductase-like NAD-dependent aldehyde dehydrogenase